jgi:hypothetical protein
MALMFAVPARGLRVPLPVGGGQTLVLCGWASALEAKGEALSPAFAARVLEDVLTDAAIRARIAAVAEMSGTIDTVPQDLIEWLRSGLEHGNLVLVRVERPAHIAPLQGADSEEAVLGPEETTHLDIEYDVEYADASPVKDLKYVLTDQDGAKEKGRLPVSGIVRKKDVKGPYSLALVDVESVECNPARVKAKEDVTVSARVSGMDDGAQGKAKVFRLYDEDPKNAVATLPVTVAGNRVETKWKYEPKSDAEAGVASFVAEVSFDDGKIWRKSDPLQVELPAVKSVTWSTPGVGAGDDVQLQVEAPGFTDGADVKVTLVRLSGYDDETIGDLDPMQLQGGGASASLHVGDAKLPAKTGDVYAKVTVKKDGIERKGHSPVLWVSAAPSGADDGGGDDGDSGAGGADAAAE